MNYVNEIVLAIGNLVLSLLLKSPQTNKNHRLLFWKIDQSQHTKEKCQKKEWLVLPSFSASIFAIAPLMISASRRQDGLRKK